MNYDKKLHKVTKRFKNARLVKAITKRELFTRHGLHVNKKGKEIMISKIIDRLLTNANSQTINVIHLPWKIETVKQIANEQSVSTVQINDRGATTVKKNVKTKEILCTKNVWKVVRKQVGAQAKRMLKQNWP
jgi:hypothetical protein